MRTLLPGLLGVATSLPAAAATLYVDDDAGPGGNGTAASPFASVQDAVDAAANADEIRVAEGAYAPFVVSSKEIELYGGFDAAFSAASGDTPSVVQGAPDGPVVTLYEVGDSVLDGFVIRGGQRGLYIDAYWNSTTNRPTVSNNVIEENGAPDVVGGGVFADHCDPRFTGNTLRDNIGDRGAGLAASCNSLVIDGNVVEGNVGYGDHGGGLYMAGATIVLRDNLVRDNEIGVIAGYGWGAGALVFNQGTSATFERNVFTGNHAESVGGGAFVDDGAVATFDHDLFYANQCSSQGGAALYVDGYSAEFGSEARLSHVTIADHDCRGAVGNAVYAEEQSVVTLVNSVVWDNGGNDFAELDTSTITATYTLTEDGVDGEGNLSADPLFVDPDAGDFHVRSTEGRFDAGEWVQDGEDSPTIDAGDPAAAFDLEPGPNGLRVNMGHTGNTGEASMGGPGGVPPEEADEGGRGGGPAESCSCASGGASSLVAVPLVLALLRRRRAPALALALSGCVPHGGHGPAGGDPTAGDPGACTFFPADNPWNTDVSQLPLHPDSDTFIDAIGRGTTLHPDFGTTWQGAPIGIPFVEVPADQPRVPVDFRYGSESDPGPYPIPADAPIEGGPNGDGDRHVIALDRESCTLFELFDATPQQDGASWQAGSGAIFDLTTNDLRPDGYTSADAAGLPILPGLVRYDEVVEQGEVRHAIRFTVADSQRGYVHPATHFASSDPDPALPPMGLRLRMKAGWDCSGLSAEVRVLCTAFKAYGLFVADNGSDWYVSGVPDERWDEDAIHDLGELPGDAFEAVYTGDIVTD